MTNINNQLIEAIFEGSLKEVRKLLAQGADINGRDDEGYFPLHACIDGSQPYRCEMLQLLIDSGANINIGASLPQMALNSWTPLHLAAARGDLETIKILLDNGADTAIRTIIDDYATAEEEARILGKNEAAELIRNYQPPERQKIY